MYGEGEEVGEGVEPQTPEGGLDASGRIKTQGGDRYTNMSVMPRAFERAWLICRQLLNFEFMDWSEYIVSDKEVLLGKPTIKGTRISVDHIISLLAQGWSEDKILSNYPRLSKDSLKAVFVYIYECLQDGLLSSPTGKAK